MIELITGLPGNGKTLYAISYIKDRAERESRPVYYNGISDLKLPWIELVDPERWTECPPNSIIVIDEAQRVFRPRANGSLVPKHVAELETHRHRGVDIILITQHPMLIESNVRRLCGRHLHCVRMFGMQASTVHEWGSVKEACDKSRADSVQHKFVYPVSAYGWYHSAEVHTHKRRLPMRLIVLLAVPVLIGICVWFFWSWHLQTSAAPVKGKAVPVLSGGAPVPGSVPGPPSQGRPMTTGEYVAARTPRIVGLPASAPVYDKLSEPKSAPRPAACLSMGKVCKCYTQQGTLLPDTPAPTCRDIAHHGWFDPGAPDTGYQLAGIGPAVEAPPAPGKPSAPSVGAVPRPPGSDAPKGAVSQPDTPSRVRGGAWKAP